MFCNNCGNPLQDSQHFCSQCGTKQSTQTSITCHICGTILDNGAKFCKNCGASVQEEKKRICQSCGTELQEMERFCPKCGNPFTESKKSLEKPFQIKAIKTLANKLAPNESPKIKSLSVKHAFLAGIFALILILLFIPSYQLELPSAVSLIDDDLEEINISVGNPLSGDMKELMEYVMDDDELDIMSGLYGFGAFVNIVIFGLASFFTFYPLIKHTISKRRRLVYQFIISVFTIIKVLWNYIIWAAMTSMINDKISLGKKAACDVSFTFGGILLLLMGIVAFVLCIITVRENRNLSKNTHATYVKPPKIEW